MKTKTDDSLSMAGLIHDLNNVFQTLVGVALQTGDPVASGAILRSVERASHIVGEMQGNQARLLPLEVIVANAAAFVKDHSGSAVEIVSEIDRDIELSGSWERVLINLFLNSVREMPHGGTIRVAARDQEGAVVIVVADEGPGIAEALLGTLFEPHVSGNGSSGLGLSIVNSIVQASGGSIRATNLERGAEFTIRLPRATKAKSAGR
jgi:signal transduction histidine kinase